ncbi:26310_t:CDS:10, partial [Dentiscutata erythropus]
SECYLNLHGRTEANWGSTIYSSPNAIGLILGIGNVGDTLKDFTQSDTYLSRDAGRNWEKIKSGQSLYEFGDKGTIIVVIDNGSPTNELNWNYGKNWENFKFYEKPVRVLNLMTNPKLSSMKFVITGTIVSNDGSQYEPTIITVDFTNLEKRDCSNDFELWDPMEGSDNQCLLGEEVKYWRRKADRECKISGANLDLNPKTKTCDCPDPDRPVNCHGEYKGKSGYRKIHKTKCIGGIDLEKEETKFCNITSTGIIKSTKLFDARIKDYFYFKDNKTVIIRTDDNKVWQSKDSGFSWDTVKEFENDAIVTMVQNAYFKDSAYFITMSNYHFYTNDGGSTFKKMDVPMGPNTLQIPIFDFHPEHKEWLIYTGCKDCDELFSSKCHTEAYYTKNNGEKWDLIDTYVRVCSWARDEKFKVNGEAIFCESYEEKSGSQRTSFKNPRFCYSKDLYKDPKCIIENVVGFASFEEYVVVAQLLPSGQSLKLYISVNGETFAEAQFPPGLAVPHNAFTILQSNTHSIALHVTETTHTLWGNILKSNSNGTYYGLSLERVNRDDYGFVDFEKMQGIEGIAIANVVFNYQKVIMGSAKKLQSKITFNDGGTWQSLTSPNLDSNNNTYDCGNNCYLHLHSYTERRDPRDSFSSSSATGLMMGVGNVGEYLTNYLDGDTFLTRDAGLTWNEIKKGAYMYDFGDQGLNWVDYQVTESKNLIKFHDIATSPGGLSSKFILRGRYMGSFDKEVIVFLDFTGILPEKCILNINDPDNDDYELWSPTHPNNEKCLFGHKTQYYRRNLTKNCQVGDDIISHKEITENCVCTSHDFECDYNFIRDGDNCKIVDGAQPLQANIAEQCANNGGEFYYETNGYVSSDEAKFLGTQHECPGLGRSTLLWVMIILSPFIIVGIVTACYVYRRRDRFGYSPLGQIRLGDHSSPTSFILSIPSLFMDMIYSIREFL